MRVFVSDVIAATVDVSGVCEVDLLGNGRNRRVAYPRQAAAYLARQLTGRSLPEVGRRLGGRHHTTILFACSQVEKRMRVDIETQILVARIAHRAAERAAARASQAEWAQ
jgi:chromosomal replication initiator protein